MEPQQYEQRGYLREDFRLFHLADSDRPEIAYHYHTFHKIILLLAGRAGYCVEGERYELAPGDLVVIGRGSIHRPELRQGDFYERMILYISPEFLEKNSTPDCDLAACFQQAQSRFQYVYRTGADDEISPLLTALEQAGRSEEFGAALLQRAVAVQLLVQLNRTVLARHAIPAAAGDSKIVAILQYLNLHLTEPITIDELAGRFYLSKYHMMRRFRQETGYTIHHYLMEKRLMLASSCCAPARRSRRSASMWGIRTTPPSPARTKTTLAAPRRQIRSAKSIFCKKLSTQCGLLLKIMPYNRTHKLPHGGQSSFLRRRGASEERRSHEISEKQLVYRLHADGYRAWLHRGRYLARFRPEN